MLKAVVQAIPTFAMSCFWIPVGLCQGIKALIRKFWWGQWGARRKIHWKKWEVLCKSKEEGGLGFKDLCKFNEALLAKQVWRLIHDEHSLFYKVFKAKYFPRGSIFEASVSSGSYAWQSILKSRHLIEKGARWRVGNGHLVKIFLDKWLPTGEGVLVSSSSELHPEARVSKLINQVSGWWNVQLIDRCFHPPDATRIKALPLCSTPQPYILIWPHEKSGIYSVKSRFRLLCEGQDSMEITNQENPGDRMFWKKLWKIQVPGKIKHFLWRACTNSLATKDNLVKRKIFDRCEL